MSLDDKLKSWREGTEPLAPSDALLAKLAAAVEAAPVSAAPSAGTSASGIAIKVFVVAVAVGVSTWAWLVRAPTEVLAGQRSAPAVTQVDAGASEGACPPQPMGGAAVPAIMIPQRAESEHARAERLRSLKQALTARPLTCEAQQTPLTAVLAETSLKFPEKVQLLARLAYLCGTASVPRWAVPPADFPACDGSDWCHAPSCDQTSEDCARQWAARPSGSCNAAYGRNLLANLACEPFLRGSLPRNEVEALNPRAWCLHEAAMAEAELLRRTAKGTAQ